MNCKTIIVALSVLLVGCTHTRQFSNYNEINSLTKGKVAKLKLSQGVNFKGRDIQITPDSTYWLEPGKGIMKTVSTSQVLELIIVNRWRGAWEGFRTFLFAGASLGVILFLEGDDPPGWFSSTAEEKFLLGNAVGIMYGVILGVPIGAVVGSKDVFILNPLPLTHNPLDGKPPVNIFEGSYGNVCSSSLALRRTTVGVE